jgi:ChaB/Rho termination factor, N-terminal domain
MPGRQELPTTLRRSDAKAQRTWIAAHDNAVTQYGEGARAHQTAWAALERTHAKVGDRWEPKSSSGPSNPPGRGRNGGRKTYGGVDYEGSTRSDLYERARVLGIPGRSRMNKSQLALAIARAQ